MGEGYWVWLIPLATGSTSVGIVADPRIHRLQDLNSFEKSMAWLRENEPECAESIEPHREKMQDFLAMGKRQRFWIRSIRQEVTLSRSATRWWAS